jgi:CRP-like cAMP-binding protein
MTLGERVRAQSRFEAKETEQAATAARKEDILTEWIRRVGADKRVDRGTTVFDQGATTRGITYLEEGYVTLRRMESTGLDVIVGLRHGGAVLGAAATLSHLPSPVAAVARTGIVLRWVPLSMVTQALRHNDMIRSALLIEVGREATAYAAHCGALGCLDAHERLIRLLLDLSTSPTVDPVWIPLGTTELGSLLGIDASYVRRLLRGLKRDGHIETARGGVVVRNRAVLQQQPGAA